uniref:Race-specific elicitor A4 n=1 Tax=Lygus hesperus TaxID=30085 RepID=A0A0A9XPH7_LYGHE
MTSAVAAVVLLATFTVVWTAPPNPCFRAQMPNDEDPYSFYKCDAGGKAHLWRCAAGTMYDRRTQICDWEDQVRGRNGQTGTGGGARPSNSGNRGEGGREGREGGGRRPNRPNRPANREPGPLDPDYDNGEDWGEMENWRDQFRESENMSQRGRENGTSGGRPRENGNGGGRDRENGGRNTPPRNTPRLDCSDRADGAGGAPRMYPNPDDCATYFTCNMRRPVLTYCPRGLNYNPRRRGCDDSEPSNCRTVRASQTPADVFIYNRRLHQIVNDSKSSSEEEIALPTRR